MRLFIREHLLLIALQIVQFAVILLLFWLDGWHHLGPGLYAVFLGFFFLGCYLAYQYVSRRAFYQRLEQGIGQMDASLNSLGHVPIAAALSHLLNVQYKLYMREITEAQERQEGHLQFIDKWVHQMKTPLSVIELTAQHLDEPHSSDIREETERMRTGLNTVLYMARLRTIEQDFHIRPVGLARLVREVNMEHRRYFIRNDVYPKVEESREQITVETDEKWLFFVIEQLIHNAVKYSAGLSKRIDIAIYERGKRAVLEVRDQGIGIPAADRKRIFDKFFTGNNGRAYRESTGMGLYLVKEVCQYLGHKIEMESEAGKGTVFRIVFSPEQNLTNV